MRIALDAMGSDHAPAVEIEGAVEALRNSGGRFRLVLVGDRQRIEEELERYPEVTPDQLEIVHASQRIDMGEPPAQAVRRKPQSSIAIGLGLQKRREVDAFISAGSTGATMAASLLMLRPLPGVDRPAVGAVFPTVTGHALVLDAGANVDTRPHHLLQFAHLGSIYAEDLMGVARPRVGLLNIGEEPEKGDERVVEAYRLLAADGRLNFVGNIEGRDIVRGGCDVLVCDGFVGNVLLKFYESIAGLVATILRRGSEGTGAEPHASRILDALDYTKYGGAPLLGVGGVTIICHGGSPPRAIRNAIQMAAQAVERGMVAHIGREMSRLAEVAPA